MAGVKAPGKEAVAERLGVRFEFSGQVDRDIGAKRPTARFLGQEAAFKRAVAKALAHADDFGTENPEGLGI